MAIFVKSRNPEFMRTIKLDCRESANRDTGVALRPSNPGIAPQRNFPVARRLGRPEPLTSSVADFDPRGRYGWAQGPRPEQAEAGAREDGSWQEQQPTSDRFLPSPGQRSWRSP